MVKEKKELRGNKANVEEEKYSRRWKDKRVCIISGKDNNLSVGGSL